MATIINIKSSDYTNILPNNQGGFNITGYSGEIPTSVDDIISIELIKDANVWANVSGLLKIGFYDDPNGQETGEVTYTGIDSSKTFEMHTSDIWWFIDKTDPSQTEPDLGPVDWTPIGPATPIPGVFFGGKKVNLMTIDGKNVTGITLNGKKLSLLGDITITAAEITQHIKDHITVSGTTGKIDTSATLKGFALEYAIDSVASATYRINSGDYNSMTVLSDNTITLSGWSTSPGYKKKLVNGETLAVYFKASVDFVPDYGGELYFINQYVSDSYSLKLVHNHIRASYGETWIMSPDTSWVKPVKTDITSTTDVPLNSVISVTVKFDANKALTLNGKTEDALFPSITVIK